MPRPTPEPLAGLRARMSVADDLVARIRAGNELYLAGVQAADENSPSARKLAALLSALDELKIMLLADHMDGTMSAPARNRALTRLCNLTKEARR